MTSSHFQTNDWKRFVISWNSFGEKLVSQSEAPLRRYYGYLGLGRARQEN